ncbi:Oidioi.mRNA.OKI2018_I69.chr1.g30.t1.cds [Oikopleura dioica]|uniref:Oidioi.mRNA.OKI2018_I69.chr1.g30.t1.cds n=1 Tax=Oikopleura dioica TaxID=34765 RepID=A0ABN7SKA6_OIKDI|nr:Oidioi.mRNA.OKI2018_I69.chr1.g30.t1.cds [Oikopleura dioica]
MGPVRVLDEYVLQDLQKLFRSPIRADIDERRAILRQYIQVLKSRDIKIRETYQEDGAGDNPRSVTVYVPTKLPLTAENFAKGNPEFVYYFIKHVLPGGPKYINYGCCPHPFDNRLYRYPVISTGCGYKSGWNENMPLSEEDEMLMECTGWNQAQLWEGMKRVQSALDSSHCCALYFKLVVCAFILFFFVMAFIDPTHPFHDALAG